MEKSIEQMIEELNAECNRSLCITYYADSIGWEITAYDSENFDVGHRNNKIYDDDLRTAIEKAMEKLELNLEISQEEEDKIINAKKKTLEKLIKIAESRRKNDGK